MKFLPADRQREICEGVAATAEELGALVRSNQFHALNEQMLGKVDELFKQALICEVVPLDESEETRAAFVRLDEIWAECLALYKMKIGLDDLRHKAGHGAKS